MMKYKAYFAWALLAIMVAFTIAIAAAPRAGTNYSASGGTSWVVGGTETIASGGAFTAASGSTTTFASGATASFASGSTTTFASGSTLAINTLSTTTNGVGAKNGTTVTAVEYGNGAIHKTVLTLTALPLTLRDTEQGLGVKIYDFPEGRILFLGATGSVAETTTSTLTSSLNTGVTYNWGVGSTTQANGTLATTEQNIVQTTNGTASATVNVAGAASNGVGVLTPLDGTTTPLDAFFNVGIAGADDIDGNATTTYTGTVTITWMNLGDY